MSEIRRDSFPSISFAENPEENSEFGTVNGEVDVSFKRGLSADLMFDTMNGEVMTDFEYAPLTLVPRKIEQRGRSGHSTTYKVELQSGIRIADGGPRFRFSNINGNIFIRKSR